MNQVAAPSARSAVLLGVVLIAINIALVVGAPERVSTFRLAMGSALLWVSAFPSWRYLHSRAREVPFLPAFGVFYFFCYGLPAFGLLRMHSTRIEEPAAEIAIGLALIGLVLLFAAFYVFRPSLLPQLRLDLELRRSPMLLLVVAAVAVVVRVYLAGVELPSGLRQLSVFVTFVPTALLGGLLLLRLRGQLSNWIAIPAALLLAVVLLLDFGTSSMAEPAMTAATLMFVFVAERRRVPVPAIAIVFTLLIAGLGIKQDFRVKMARSKNPIGTVERIGLITEMMSSVFTETRSVEKATDVARSRVDHLSAFAWVIKKTGTTVPYWEGATYADFVWSFVPRFIYPDKPTKELGQAYGHRYGFLFRNDRETSINLEQTVEMYANFGVAGVLIGMFLMGLLYRAAYQCLNHPLAGDGGLLIAAGTFRVMLNIESDFSVVYGAILQSGLLLYVLLYLLYRVRTHATASEANA